MTATTGFEAYSMYTGLKQHFTSSYDFIKYRGITKVSKDSFAKNKFKYQFYKLSRKYDTQDLRDFYVSNFVDANVNWVGELLSPESEERYLKWKKRNQSLTYRFKQDILYMMDIFGNPDRMLKVTDGQHPPLLREVLIGIVSLETVAILNDILKFFPMWSKNIEEDVIWPSWERKIVKYTPFINYDKDNFVSILKELLREHAEA